MKLIFRRFFIGCCLIIITTHLHAQSTIIDSTQNIRLEKLDLAPDQKIALKELITEYKLDNSKRRQELKRRMFLILNVRQQRIARRW